MKQGSAAKKKATGAGTGAAIRAEARHLMNTYKRPPVVFTHGKGCYLYDHRGRAYLDFLGGIAVNALGHAHPRVVAAIRREAVRAIHISNLYHNPYQGPLAAKLAKWSGLDRVFFTNSGTEAIEGALKLARLHARKAAGAAQHPPHKFLALENSFHGRTFGAVSITSTAKYREPFAPLVPGVEFVRFNDVEDLTAKFDSGVCAIVLETVQGEGGIHRVSEAFYRQARQLATRRGAALIADEIQCGLGRTGRAFAYQKYATAPEWLPDIVTVAKPIAAGLPLGAFLAREEFAQAFTPGVHGTTFGGGPLICAVALEVLSIIEEEKLMENARERGEEICVGLAEIALHFDGIREIRGEGLMIGMELGYDGTPCAEAALAERLLINCTHERTLRLLPALNVTPRHVAEFLEKMERALAKSRPQPQIQIPAGILTAGDHHSESAHAAGRHGEPALAAAHAGKG
ncbi:MAG TPA: aspartate aminotransferase family protein [Candidatus Acidoferrales bacterium]|nr:aspartate aminotransferase family protein [Candidatus Acidoferrales bacterium]